MAVIPALTLARELDELCRFYDRALGTSASGYGIGTAAAAWGAAGAIQNLKQLVAWDFQGSLDGDPLNAVLPKVTDLEAAVAGSLYARNQLSTFILALDSHVTKFDIAGVRSIDDYLTYLNAGAGGTWAALQHPHWRTLRPSPAPSAWNVFFEVLQGATYANALYKHIVGTGNTDGAVIDSALYCGGFPVLRVTGLAGSATVTVTGTVFDRATKAISTVKTFTAAVTANGLWFMVVGTAPANSLIIDVTSITVPGGITAGTIYVESWRPNVRNAAAVAGAATTITLDASASLIDDFYVGLPIIQAADQYAGLRTITDYVGSTKVATVNSAWGVNPGAATNFKILRDDIP